MTRLPHQQLEDDIAAAERERFYTRLALSLLAVAIAVWLARSC